MLVTLSDGLRTLAVEVGHIANSVTMLTIAVQKHNEAINDLHAVQEMLLKHAAGIGPDVAGPIKEKSQKLN